jgi:hypothetical protein
MGPKTHGGASLCPIPFARLVKRTPHRRRLSPPPPSLSRWTSNCDSLVADRGNSRSRFTGPLRVQPCAASFIS